MLLGLHKNLSFNSGKYPYATGGDYVYLYEEGNKTYRVHEFLTAGATATLNVEVGGKMDILVVGGGGGGGMGYGQGGGGGGGGGGVLSEFGYSVTTGSKNIYVGSGGAGSTNSDYNGENGENSSFNSEIVSYGGGGGGSSWRSATAPLDGSDGGCGGGGAARDDTAGSPQGLGGNGVTGQGFPGGNSARQTWNQVAAGGGGGAGGTGHDAVANATETTGGNGGNGKDSGFGKGRLAGGGGGSAGRGAGSDPPTTAGSGVDGGGNGSLGDASSGTANTGGGGGGSKASATGAGGSGIVIVRYVVAEKKLWTPSELDLGSQTAATWVDTSEFSSISSLSPNFTDKVGVVYAQNGNPPIQASLNNNFALDLNTAYAPNGFGNLTTGYINAVILERSAYFVGRAVTTNSTENTGIAGQSEYASANFAIGFKMENTTSASSAPAGTFSLMAECSFAPGFDVVYPIIQLTSKSTNTYLSTSDYHIFCVTTNYSTGDINLYANGSLVASSTGNSETIPNLQRGGGIYKISGTNSGGQTTKRATPIFGEFIVTATDDDQNNSQARIKMEGYLAHKWGLTNNLPAGHPYKYEPPYKVEPEEIVTDGLVLNLDAGDYASYPRSGTTWYDISGNGLTGALTNGPTYDSANKGSIVFDGSNDNVPVGNIGSFTAMTFCTFIKRNGNQISYAGLIFNREANPNITGLNFRYNNELGYHWNSNSSSYNWISGLAPPDGEWFMSALTVTSTSATMYLCTSSGISTATNNISHGSTTLNDLIIGLDEGGAGNRYYKGNIGTIQIYNRALSSTEISQNFNALRGRYGI